MGWPRLSVPPEIIIDQATELHIVNNSIKSMRRQNYF